jgi:predicted N-acetyltransferase YhbS
MDLGQDDLTIRTLQLSDAPRLTKIDHQITGRQRSAWYEGKLRRALEESDVRISLGAEKDGILVGALLGSLQYGEFGQPEPLAILDTILVDPAFSGQGVGTAMLEQLVKNLHAFGIERLRTEVSWDEHALSRFLGRHGFVPMPRLVLELAVGQDRGEKAVPEPRQSAGSASG